MDDFIAGIEIDPGFPAFVALCREQGHDVTVVSDGLDRTVEAVLKRHDLDLPYYANHLEWRGDGSLAAALPACAQRLRGTVGQLQVSIHRRCAGAICRMVIGDGRSDFCIARRADLVLAKSALLAALRRQRAAPFARSRVSRRPAHLGRLARWPRRLCSTSSAVAAGRRLALGMSENRCKR